MTIANNVFYEAQEMGIIGPYQVCIEIDMDEVLGIEVLEKEDGEYTVRLTNNTGSKIEVVYNQKMCYESDARNWSGLTDIATKTIYAGKSASVTVAENGLATDIAFSYIADSERIVVFAADVAAGNTLTDGLSSELSRVEYTYYDCVGDGYAYYGCLSIVGKNDDTWIIRVSNTFGEKVTFQYNKKMCFKSDALDWSGLSDLSSEYTVSSGSSKTIYIEENGTAGYITMRFTTSTAQTTIYANELDSSCTMTVYSSQEPVYEYLTLTNSGKSSGSWLINVTNPTESAVIVYYNTKMCYESDAKEWSDDLDDIESFTLKAGATKQVSVSTNWFATCVVFSYVNTDGIRLITYADGLSSDGDITVMYSYVTEG